jgi:hypothetical protein
MLLDVVVINARVSTRTGNSKSNFVGRPAEFVVSGANLTPTEVAAVTHFHIKTATEARIVFTLYVLPSLKYVLFCFLNNSQLCRSNTEIFSPT